MHLLRPFAFRYLVSATGLIGVIGKQTWQQVNVATSANCFRLLLAWIVKGQAAFFNDVRYI